MECYSKHPLAAAIVRAGQTQGAAITQASQISEKPGQGLFGTVSGQTVRITNRKTLLVEQPQVSDSLPLPSAGLECVILVNDTYVATYQFRDAPRREGASFIEHLGPRHRIQRVMLLSGDRESEVRYLADQVGVSEIHADKSPEEKLTIVRAATVSMMRPQ